MDISTVDVGPGLVERLLLVAEHLGYAVITYGCAICAHLFYAFPEWRRLAKVIKDVAPKLEGESLSRTRLLVSAFVGTFLTSLILLPSTPKEAALAGLLWPALVRQIIQSFGKSQD